MFFAQAVNSYGTTTEQVGVWVGCFCALLFAVVMILTGANQGLKLFKPARKRKLPEERYVTRGELKMANDALWREVKDLRSRSEDHGKAVTALTVSAVSAQGEMRKMIDMALEPVEKKLDRLMHSMAHVTAKLKVEDGDES